MLGRDGLGSYYAAANLNPGYYLQLAAINDRVGALLLNSYGQPGGQEFGYKSKPGPAMARVPLQETCGAVGPRGDTAYLACEGNVYVWTGSSLQKVASVHWPARSGHGVVPLDPRPTLAT